jgi:hypothetical protein
MRGYGLPRHKDVECPDLVDIRVYGLKTSTGQIKSKGGDYRGSTKTKLRNESRRRLKKNERNGAKMGIRKQIMDL